MKLAISVALSHHSKLLILDEATSGLDPVIRDDILDMLLDFVQEEDHSILVSSTSPRLERSDYIVFIHEEKWSFPAQGQLVEQYGVLKCGAASLTRWTRPTVIVVPQMDYEWNTGGRRERCRRRSEAMVVPATIDEIMLSM